MDADIWTRTGVAYLSGSGTKFLSTTHLVWLFHLSRTSLTGYDALTFVTTPLIVTSQIYHFLVTIVYIHNMDNLPLSVETPETPTT